MGKGKKKTKGKKRNGGKKTEGDKDEEPLLPPPPADVEESVMARRFRSNSALSKSILMVARFCSCCRFF